VKILYLHDGALDRGKANGIQALNMCRALARLGHEVALAVPSRESGPSVAALAAQTLDARTEFHVIPYRKLSVGGRLSMVGGWRAVQGVLRADRCDLCFTRNPVYLEATLRMGLPAAYEAHNLRLHANPLWDWMLTRNTIRRSRHFLLRGFICISRRLSDAWAAAGVPTDKILCAHDGVDVEAFRRPVPLPEARLALRLPLDRKVVTYAGSLYRNRDLGRLVDLSLCFPDACFVVVGGAPAEVKELQDHARRKGAANLSCVGRIPHAHVREYLFASDVLLMVWSRQVPTIEYCSPLKVFEYMAAGRTIVGDGFPTIREVLTDGQTALLAEPGCWESLRARVAEALTLPVLNPLAQEARRLAFRRYSWTTRAQRISDFLVAAHP
jgi:glycosyltransferase involved in cell wall biosynthesis